ncbi:MAG: hypothetical protein K2L00_07690 [Muribaculaceae bacterium]|nr:hypothetical protein [Muribaculaceae bacterium]
MNYLLKILLVAVALATAIPSSAVTDKEMEQARAIAAKHYLRYANNGSDYLDKLSPSSVSELSKQLKGKEKENIKSFNAVATPKDYASWDKQKLVEYWSKTFFNAPGLNADGKRCLTILAKNLNKMSVAAPQASKPAEAAETQATKPTEAKPAEANPAAETTPAAQPAAAQPAEAPASDDAVEAAVAQAEADAGLADEQPRKASNTGWYIAILVLLVGVVIWLVMYASKSMKESGATLSDHQAGEREIREAKRAAKEEQNKMREQYASSLTSKNDEIKQLKAQYATLEGELDTARRDAESARRELEAAKRELAQLRQRAREQKAQEQRPQSRPQPQPQAQARPQSKPAEQQAAPAKQPMAARPGGLPPVVFLGYVNQKGLFTKASRSLNVELSVYRMDVPDGFHGKYRVVNDTEILDRLIEDPQKWLAGGCDIENPEDADIAAEIVTLEPGEALFADNSCRVTKKARIKFI